MNIFVLSTDIAECAEQHNDSHTRKMVIEYSQLLSTAHRVLDGTQYYGRTKNGRKISRWSLPDEREDRLYKATHVNHPSAIWVRQSEQNYKWLYRLLQSLLLEYSHRYERLHKSASLLPYLWFAPQNIDHNQPFTMPPQAMPDYCKRKSVVDGYRTYYIYEKAHLAHWKKRDVPEWYSEELYAV